jgi:hypothetical protein
VRPHEIACEGGRRKLEWERGYGRSSAGNLLVMPGLGPGIHVFSSTCGEDVDGRAFATPKGLRPRRRVKPGHDESWKR